MQNANYLFACPAVRGEEMQASEITTKVAISGKPFS